MNEADFIKEHPSLKDKLCVDIQYKDSKATLSEPFVNLDDIYATQLDKQKVREMIESMLKEIDENVGFAEDRIHTYGYECQEEILKELKNELGL